MFQAPLSITTDTAFELPSHLHEIGDENPWVATQLWPRHAHSYLNALTFDDAGNLWIADTPFGRIFRITPSGDWDLIVKYDGWPAGLRFQTESKLLVADSRHGLLSLDVSARALTPQVTHHLGERFRGLNDLCVAKSGEIYLTDAGQSGVHDLGGALYRLKADGELQCLLNELPGPAGVALASDERSLLVAMRDGAIWRMPLLDGGVARASVAIQLSGGIAPEGVVADADGNLLIAHHGLGCVWMFDKRGEPKYRLDSSRGDWITNVAIDPRNPSDVYMTDAQTGSVLKATLPMY